jgi:chromosome segregation ATPase
LKDEIRDILELLRDLQKDVSQLEAIMKSHLDGSDIRVKNWEKDFEGFQQTVDSCKTKIQELIDFKKSMLQEKGFIILLFKAFGGIVATLVGLAGIYKVFK